MDEHSADKSADTSGDTRDTSAAGRYRVLPERTPLEDLTVTIETDAAPDPKLGRDPDTEWMLRHG